MNTFRIDLSKSFTVEADTKGEACKIAQEMFENDPEYFLPDYMKMDVEEQDTVIKSQKDLHKFVSQHFIYNQTMLVTMLLEKINPALAEIIINYFPEMQWCDNCQQETKMNAGDNCSKCGEAITDIQPAEIYEWWLVSDWMFKKLEEKGEAVLKTDWGDWWGRTCTGQAIYIDGVVEEIYSDVQR
jgi:hypothetical protein